jgi:hypothetical protein
MSSQYDRRVVKELGEVRRLVRQITRLAVRRRTKSAGSIADITSSMRDLATQLEQVKTRQPSPTGELGGDGRRAEQVLSAVINLLREGATDLTTIGPTLVGESTTDVENPPKGKKHSKHSAGSCHCTGPCQCHTKRKGSPTQTLAEWRDLRRTFKSIKAEASAERRKQVPPSALPLEESARRAKRMNECFRMGNRLYCPVNE